MTPVLCFKDLQTKKTKPQPKIKKIPKKCFAELESFKLIITPAVGGICLELSKRFFAQPEYFCRYPWLQGAFFSLLPSFPVSTHTLKQQHIFRDLGFTYTFLATV